MAVAIACPHCGASGRVEEASLGRRGRCKRCGESFELTPREPSPPAGQAPVDLPERFGRYRIVRKLGQGGMGAVYLARDSELDRPVALKVPFFAPQEGPEAIERFRREARTAATLDHPNLCPVFDVGTIDGVHYLTMPYLEGKTLQAILEARPSFTEAQAVAIVRKLALAVQVAHERGIIHRDLKPGNILINRHRDLVVMDFGLARRETADDSPLTRTGLVLGTALYMAPEQAAGDASAIGPPCDVYALGVILYEMLTGVRPFEGPWSLVIGLKNVMDPDPPSKHRPGLGPAVEAACLKAIARAPRDRYATAAEFARALEEALARPAATGAPGNVSVEPPGPATLADRVFAGLALTGLTSRREKAATDAPGPVPSRPASSRLPLILGGVAALALALASARAWWPRAPITNNLAGPAHRTAARPEPSVDRTALRCWGDGDWKVEGNELVLEGEGEQGLLFGNPSWTDYDFRFDAMHDRFPSGLRVFFRSPDPSRVVQFNYGWIDYAQAFMEYAEGGTRFRPIRQGGVIARTRLEDPILAGRWYRMKVEVRGQTTRAFCDGRLIFEIDSTPFDRGRVGLGTWYKPRGRLRVRDIRVTAPDGKSLWEGTPKLGDAGPL